MKRSFFLATAAATVAAMPRAFANDPSKRVEPILTGVAKIAMPERANKRGSVSIYPFDTLIEVGTAFGVKNKTATQLSSIVSNANRKALTPKLDDAGNPVFGTKELTGQDGTKTAVPDTENPTMVATKHFFAFDVTDEYRKANKDAFAKGGPFEGVTALVFRDK